MTFLFFGSLELHDKWAQGWLWDVAVHNALEITVLYEIHKRSIVKHIDGLLDIQDAWLNSFSLPDGNLLSSFSAWMGRMCIFNVNQLEIGIEYFVIAWRT